MRIINQHIIQTQVYKCTSDHEGGGGGAAL